MKRRHGKKNLLIGFLIAAILMMSVGYAALASQLNIEGYSKITGDFKVEFTSITEGSPVGDATNVTPAAIVGATTATFDVEFVSPGDKMTYEIVVKNTGNLPAKLDDITGLPTESNDPIKYTVTGVAVGDTLAVEEEKTITIVAEYVSSVTSQPTDDQLSKDLSITLNYVQSLES